MSRDDFLLGKLYHFLFKKKKCYGTKKPSPLSMKNILSLICLVITLGTTSLLAQVREDDSLTSASALHVGAGASRHSIGSAENPVTAEEYCAFLMSDNNTWRDNYYNAYLFYDGSFMTTDAYFNKTSSHPSIHCQMPPHWWGDSTYMYTVVPGHENDIIDAVFYKDCKAYFDAWRATPSVAELYDYISAMVDYNIYRKTASLEAAIAMRKCYPENCETAFTMANNTVQELCAGMKISHEMEGVNYRVIATPLSADPYDTGWVYDIQVKTPFQRPYFFFKTLNPRWNW